MMIRRRRECAACGHRWTTYEGDMETLRCWLFGPMRALRLKLFEAEQTMQEVRTTLADLADAERVEPSEEAA